VKGSVAVIGGGVTGMVASLDLADLGFRVYLVENKPSIGGVMSQLDKTFPTLDCSMCTLAPRMVEVARHPNIELMTYSEVEGIDGSVGDFRLKVRRKATFIDWDKCTGCGACAEACIAKVPNEYDDGMSTRGAAYVMFPQAIPMRAVVDRETCLDCKKKKCEEACRADAFDWEMEDKTLELEVGSVVVATGFEQLDASILGEYGWGVHPNVITALQLERLLNASGPTEGNVVKSDGSHPDHIAFILCAGSRDEKRQPYCSRVCCMYSVKEAILVREHDPSVECTVFYMDMRAFGKNQEEFFNRARDEFGINFIRSKPSNVMRHGDRLRIKYEDTDTGEAKTLEADMVTLATAMVPKTGVAETLGLKVDNYGFLKSGEHPVLSSKPGVFIAGAAEGPRDISDSVAMASSAAAHVSAALRSSRNTEIAPPDAVEEMDVGGQEPRIGVFVCHCGSNIAGVVDVEAVAEYAKTLPGVEYTTHPMYTCSEENQQEIRSAIEEHKLNRVIVAACTPRTHEPLFRETCRQAGLNPYLFEMANIREMDSWVHADRDLATEKATDLVRMAVARARILEPQQPQSITVTPAALVVGAGPAGLTAALSIAEQGFGVHLVERGEPGGMLNEMTSAFGPWQPEELKDKLVKAVDEHPLVHLHNCEVSDVAGYMGNFEATLSDGSHIPVGAIVVATGAVEWKPDKYGYGTDGVVTQLELQELIERGEIGETEKVVMLQCVGSREPEGQRTYCSRVCCVEALKNAIDLLERRPEARVYILYRDIRSYSRYEELYGQARELGVWFFRFTQENEPQISGTTVRVHDTLMDDDVIIRADRVVLSSATIPSPGTEELASMLKCPVGQDGFFLEAHLKLRPLDFTNDGLFLAGTAAGPRDLTDTLISAAGAAARACRVLSKDEIEAEGTTTVIMESLCIGCGRCEKVCPYDAITMVGTPPDLKSSVNPALCKSCGSCAAECPTGAARARHFTSSQIIDMIDAWGGV